MCYIRPAIADERAVNAKILIQATAISWPPQLFFGQVKTVRVAGWLQQFVAKV